MEEIHIRKATLKDIPRLLEFEQGVIRAERPFDPTIREDPVNYYDLANMLKDDAVAIVVAEAGGKMVASGYGRAKRARHYLDHKHYAYLGFMYTVPEFRGKGINQSILEVLKEWAKTKGLHEIRLTVYEENQIAIRAYEKAGFKKHIVEMRLVH